MKIDEEYVTEMEINIGRGKPELKSKEVKGREEKIDGKEETNLEEAARLKEEGENLEKERNEKNKGGRRKKETNQATRYARE